MVDGCFCSARKAWHSACSSVIPHLAQLRLIACDAFLTLFRRARRNTSSLRRSVSPRRKSGTGARRSQRRRRAAAQVLSEAPTASSHPSPTTAWRPSRCHLRSRKSTTPTWRSSSRRALTRSPQAASCSRQCQCHSLHHSPQHSNAGRSGVAARRAELEQNDICTTAHPGMAPPGLACKFCARTGLVSIAARSLCVARLHVACMYVGK